VTTAAERHGAGSDGNCGTGKEEGRRVSMPTLTADGYWLCDECGEEYSEEQAAADCEECDLEESER
jgi:hypothetical protein